MLSKQQAGGHFPLPQSLSQIDESLTKSAIPFTDAYAITQQGEGMYNTSGGGGLMVTGWDVLRGGEGFGCTCCWTGL